MWFENDVNMYGTQTKVERIINQRQFENDVNMYGTQTQLLRESSYCRFENDVNMYGTQTAVFWKCNRGSLRMM